MPVFGEGSHLRVESSEKVAAVRPRSTQSSGQEHIDITKRHSSNLHSISGTLSFEFLEDKQHENCANATTNHRRHFQHEREQFVVSPPRRAAAAAGQEVAVAAADAVWRRCRSARCRHVHDVHDGRHGAGDGEFSPYRLVTQRNLCHHDAAAGRRY